MEEKALEIVEAEFVQLGTIQASGPADVIKQATGIATQLAAIVNSRKLFTVIRGKKHVRVEGWTTLGAMLGVLPREVSVERQEDGGYVAVVELVRANDGAIIGRGSALCGMDEKRWGTADEYARRSMAVTRATGKAYRLGFSWIMTLAGYSPTPAEEMPGEEPKRPAPKKKAPPKPEKAAAKKAPPTTTNGNGRIWPPAIVQAIIKEKLAKNGKNAVAVLNKSRMLTPADAEDVVVIWFALYRETRATAEVEESVAIADAWWAGEMGDAEEMSE